MEKPWINNDYIRIAFTVPDVVSLCTEISRRFQDELTLEQGRELLIFSCNVCKWHLLPLDDRGCCESCDEEDE